MAYVQTNSYVTDTVVSADDITENYQEARDSLQQIELADISSSIIEDYHIAKPDRVFGNIWRFTSGTFTGNSTQFNDLDKHFVTNHIKQSEFLQRTIYQDTPHACANIFLEQDAHVVVKIYGWADAAVNHVQTDDGYYQQYALWVDEAIVGHTITRIGDRGSDTTGGFDGVGPNRRSPISIIWFDDMSAGTHTFQLRVNALLELSWINNITMIIDAAYTS